MRTKLLGSILISLVLVLGVVLAQTGGYTPGEFQKTNPNYPQPNPFYFEGKIDWNLLGITQPSNTWEYMERGIHKQDDLGDITGAIQDYQTSLSMNSPCQVVTAAVITANLVNGKLPPRLTLTPPPCMFTVRLRLGHLLSGLDSRVPQAETDPAQAISLFQEVVGTNIPNNGFLNKVDGTCPPEVAFNPAPPNVLGIDPLRLGVNALIGETYKNEAEQTTDSAKQQADYQNAIVAFCGELALSPVTSQTTALTSDQANNAHVHWELADIYEKLGQNRNEVSELQQYVLATQYHSDVYPWRISLAQKKMQELQAGLTLK
jgi:hypothetical protein